MRPRCLDGRSRPWNFNPRIPYGMRLEFGDGLPERRISIHASRMGCDVSSAACKCSTPYFNPRIPYGMRRYYVGGASRIRAYFNPRIPYGMRLPSFLRWKALLRFQSTHPVWDATTLEGSWAAAIAYFNPRIPYGMRRHSHGDTLPATLISIHASRMGCDFTFPIRTIIVNDFNPRIPYGMRPDTIRQVGVS